MTTTGDLISQTGDAVSDEWFKDLDMFALNKDLLLLKKLKNHQSLADHEWAHISRWITDLGLMERESERIMENEETWLYHFATALLVKGEKPERIGEILDWKGFEQIVSIVLDKGGYNTRHTLRFKTLYMEQREIDVIAWKKPWVWLLDCKHWSAKNPSRRGLSARPARKQEERVMELFEAMANNAHLLPWYSWKQAILIPGVVTLWDDGNTVIEGIPVIPFKDLVMRLQYHQDNIEEVVHHVYEGLGLR